MSTVRAKTPRRSWSVAFVILTLFEGGCASMGIADRQERGSETQSPSDEGTNSGTTLGTDSTTVKPGRTIAPPSMGIDLSRSTLDKGRVEGSLCLTMAGEIPLKNRIGFVVPVNSESATQNAIRPDHSCEPS
ncbi:hypothetical protein Sinac_2386 [Singulisphaera acidiphila DSM 18658]|uniref:Spondin domain-containing protein n=1 Tax=Singulisphaera acidiphila (strain ATCC BAA-1392 / DSM 18658 / VKM B-2454 / MOB10) TaxID=886293 RepID=L0DCY2_SINAD|nr:hypothetical protein Sinac_2386 [Singulisphaera acidiphila DSM 18658]